MKKYKSQREFAKQYLKRDMDAGWKVDAIIRASGGYGDPDGYELQIGGYAVLTHGKAYGQWESTKLKPYQIAVTEFEGKEELHVFSIYELVREIEVESNQLSLFDNI